MVESESFELSKTDHALNKCVRHRIALFEALQDLRRLTKRSVPASVDGVPDWPIFRLPNSGKLRNDGIAVLERVDRLLKEGS